MDKNSLIQDIKNDLNSIKKQVEITLAKLVVLESMIELDNKLGISVQTSGEQSSLELSRVQPEITSGASNEELGVEKPEPVAEPVAAPVAVSVAEPAPEPVAVSVAEPVEAPVAEAQALRNLMSVISLGDKFRFRHDLFSDSNDLFKETIEILNTIEKFDEAVSYLQGKFNWDAEDATVVYFYDIIRPKF